MTAAPRRILLTGPPGSGKTTALLALCGRLGGRNAAGFHTEEMRDGRTRAGFRVRTLSGREAVLAHVRHTIGPRVGSYRVDVAAFEDVVLPELAQKAEIYIVDEIGKMECFSERFVDAMRRILDGPASLVATVALRGGGFIAEVKEREDVGVLTLSPENREAMPERIEALLSQR